MDFVVQKKGIYWVRVVVPDELVKIFGKKNLMESLCTKDPTVAKHTRSNCSPLITVERG
jgi:hypothetical protein